MAVQKQWEVHKLCAVGRAAQPSAPWWSSLRSDEESFPIEEACQKKACSETTWTGKTSFPLSGFAWEGQDLAVNSSSAIFGHVLCSAVGTQVCCAHELGSKFP